MTDGKNYIQVNQLSTGYTPENDVLHDVSLGAQNGVLTVIIGPNGAGKTTFLNAVCGFLPKRSGTVHIGDKDLTKVHSYELSRYGIGYIPQGSTLFRDFMVEENLIMAGHAARKGDMNEELDGVYDRFPALKDKRRTPAGNLSGGQQKMLEVGKVIMQRPQVLLVDEPTTGIAPNLALAIYDSLRSFSQEGMTILLVDQNVRQAVEIADYVYVLNLGRIQEHGAKARFTGSLTAIVNSWFRS